MVCDKIAEESSQSAAAQYGLFEHTEIPKHVKKSIVGS